MEFHEKLQNLRKQKGLTQEELAKALYVSRTAISKWESGRGYPSIDSLRAIANFFSLTVDELLSTNEVLELAEEDGRQKERRLCDLVYGLLDLCTVLLLFLPLFAEQADGGMRGASLLALEGIRPYVKLTYFAVVIAMSLLGVLTLAMQGCQASLWVRCKTKLSLGMGMLSVLLFMLGGHPYAAVFSFVFLSVKAFLLIKRA